MPTGRGCAGEEIGDAAEQQREARRRQHESGDDPLQVAQLEAEVGSDGGYGDVEYREVDRQHELGARGWSLPTRTSPRCTADAERGRLREAWVQAVTALSP
ncbi:hypothetical protein AB0L53_32170 [Nonomuraea sp. NPDC052129]|uniref:hypothetical protein n=1 Tax=Nonomuraea sp. NPDC052129 TaxID=3154651 RepID=UPI003448EA0B